MMSFVRTTGVLVPLALLGFITQGAACGGGSASETSGTGAGSTGASGPASSSGSGAGGRGAGLGGGGSGGASNTSTGTSSGTGSSSSTTSGGPCTGGATRPCYTGPNGTESVGACKPGTQICLGGVWEIGCNGEVTPTTEVCDDVDNNCDGNKDEGLTEPCYDGPAGTNGVGVCHAGVSTCVNGTFGSCVGEVKPSPEVCDDQDNDCDGVVDGITRSCYDGKAGTLNVGTCHGGLQTCTKGAFGGPCVGEVTPVAIDTFGCYDQDANCNGLDDCTETCPDQGCFACPAANQPCICKAKGQACTQDGDCCSESCSNHACG